MNHTMGRLIEQLKSNDAAKHDEVAQATAVVYGNGTFYFDNKPIRVTGTAAKQLCAQCGIPADFWLERLTPVERAITFNRLNRLQGDTERMFRFSRDVLYGVVSPRYKKLDNILLLDILQSAQDSGVGLKPVKHTLSFDHTKVKLVPTTARVGELAPMIEFTNSENGNGSMQLWAGVFRWVCSNGMMVPVGDTIKSRWMHLGNNDIRLPDIGIVLNRSHEFLERMDRARSRYLTARDKSRIITDVASALGHTAADRVVLAANREYHGGRTLFDAVNAITRAAQSFPPQKESDMERYASTLLAA
ncbi:MAG TPA: DUF932 domain-containing protein [candidate division Zixibacteria bacterium]|nr:DUF932 domain-containing protein [candidate division Zixibacteria bacterium]